MVNSPVGRSAAAGPEQAREEVTEAWGPATLRARMVERVFAEEGNAARWGRDMAKWRTALTEVPRHVFLPSTVWVPNPQPGKPALIPLRRGDDPQRWLRLAYSDSWVTTQVDDGSPESATGGGASPTSSASAPAIVAVMLAALNPRAGDRVLEIGTGTGYNAALLAHQLRAEQVTSIEVDPTVAILARRALEATGFGEVCVITGDGAHGVAPRAPFDRVIATAAVREIPYAWVEQTRPGGRIVVPWRSPYTGALVSLTVGRHGDAAVGRVVDQASFMCLRGQRDPDAEPLYDDDVSGVVSRTRLHPFWVAGDVGARFAIAQAVPSCEFRWQPSDPDAGSGSLVLLDFVSQSWAKQTHRSLDPTDDDEFEVRQCGPRRLWDEVEAAHRWWLEQNSPGVDQWRFTVTPQGQRIELAPVISGGGLGGR